MCRFVDVAFDGVWPAARGCWPSSPTCATPATPAPCCAAADAAGADAVVFTDASVDLYNPKCVRASAGSLFHLPVVVGVPLAEVAAAAPRRPGCGSSPPTARPARTSTT